MHSTRFQRLHRRFGAALMPSRIAFLAVLLYLISLIPIFLFSSYCHPLADDFTYGLLVHRAVVSGGGIPEILSAAAETVRDYYFTWQGTFSAIFLFALQPGAFSESAYFLTPFIIIGCLSLSTFVLMHFVYCRLLGGKSSQAVILSALTLLLSVQMVTNQAQAFYWFNGASYYAVFYSFSLLFFAGIGTLLLDAGKKVHPVLTGCCALLAVLIGGGNYSTALTTSFIASVLCAAWLFFKKPGRFRLAVILLILLVSFAISVLAPGNAVRAAREASISPVLAILLSLSNAVIWVMSWVNLPQIVLFAIAGVFFYCLPDRRILPFQHPVLASTLIFGFTLRSTPRRCMLWATSAPGVRSTFTATAPTGAFLQSSITGSTGSNTPVPSHQGCPLFLLYHPTGQLSFWQASSCWPSVWWDRRILCPLSSGLPPARQSLPLSMALQTGMNRLIRNVWSFF